MNNYTAYSSHTPRASVRHDTFGDLLNSLDKRDSDFQKLLDKPFGGNARRDRLASAQERAKNRTRFPTERRTKIPRHMRVKEAIEKKMPPLKRRKKTAAEAAIDALLRLLEAGLAPPSIPDRVVSVVNPNLTFLFDAVLSPAVGPGYPIDSYSTSPLAWSAQQRAHSSQPLVQGTYPFTAVLRVSRFPSNPALPSNDGWTAGDESSMNLLNGRITWRTVAVDGVEYFNPLNNTQPFNHARKVEYYKNKSGSTQATQTTGLAPGFRPVPAPMPERTPAWETVPRQLVLGYAPEFVIETSGEKISIRPFPQARPPGGFGTKRIRTKSRAQEHKLSVGRSGAHVLRVMFSLLEMLDDAVDLWEVMIEAFPPGLAKLSRAEQIKFLANPLHWAYFDGRAFAEGFTEWAAQEYFYGRLIGKIENDFSDKIGSSNRYGASVTSRSLSDDAVGALNEWIWSQL